MLIRRVAWDRGHTVASRAVVASRCREAVRVHTRGGVVSKLRSGGGDDVRHSSVRPSQGSAGAGAPLRRLRQALSMKRSTPTPIPKAPTVEARLPVLQPASGG